MLMESVSRLQETVHKLNDAIQLRLIKKFELEESKRILEYQKAAHYQLISAETDENNKLKFSNDKMRESELTIRLTENTDLRMSNESVITKERAYLKASADVESLTWDVKSQLAILEVLRQQTVEISGNHEVTGEIAA